MRLHLPENRRHREGLLILAAIALLAIVAYPIAGRTPQPSEYHDFADQRKWWRVPNAANVLTNLAFIFPALFGFWRREHWLPGQWQRRATCIFFSGLILVAAGSGYYHWRPADWPLVPDRVPITIAFMALFALILGDSIDDELGRRALVPLLAVGGLSAVVWVEPLLNDLRPYGVVQYGSLVAMLVLAGRLPGKLDRAWLFGAGGLYLVAKVVEKDCVDQCFYADGPMGGHGWKHIFAAAATFLIAIMLTPKRRPEALT